MNFCSVRDLNTSPKEIWQKLAAEGEIVITNNGKPAALMLSVDGSDLEETVAAVRQAMAMRSVNRMRLISRQRGNDLMSVEDIRKEIKAERKGRAN